MPKKHRANPHAGPKPHPPKSAKAQASIDLQQRIKAEVRSIRHAAGYNANQSVDEATRAKIGEAIERLTAEFKARWT